MMASVDGNYVEFDDYEQVKRELAAAKAELEKWKAAGRALHSDAETIVKVAREIQDELAAAKAVIAACHEAIGESKNSDDETLADCIKQIVTEYKAEAKALRNSVISDEHLQAVASEVRLLHLVEQTATIDGMSIRACACLGPLPECLCVKRNKLVSEFLAAIDAARKGGEIWDGD